ncbi:MAG: N-6 DNA methylase [Candidatus Thiodiazotropha sp. (ex Lucina aurantia)]|nr:N-6 DNA methylase [Candidatus Thiodiazotropha taylori]MBV2099652.1 N-6 DNA methylase [Candidatus Thiodiazotropha sp. (ex Codakia orbicularis)]MBV2102810.1 N-6 DNA methylase [Candidatus Thiodiazotropha sp. (ex Lucina aurantia)]MBV2117380.1 N-6 DNA methylase [Candidatus Thiodiazotropha sp. (ex Lucina aurantia)]
MKSSSTKQTPYGDRRKLGAYYTPPELAQIMARWAIRDPADTVLEPSFGGCCFVNASWDRLRALGHKSPFKKLHGVDVDKSAFEHLRGRFTSQQFERRFVKGDYLLLPDNAFVAHKFDAIIGNPPYIGHAALTPEQRNQYKHELQRRGLTLKGRPSLWAYFVLASLSRLKPKGRMAWVLPWSYLRSHYGAQLQSILQQNFSKLLVFAIEENLFLSEGTKERSVVLFAEGYTIDPTTAEEAVYFCATFQDFRRRILGMVNDENTALHNSAVTFCARSQAERKLRRSTLTPQLRTLGELGTIDIGVVTGDMKTFMLTKSVAKLLNLKKSAFQTCLIRSQHVPGLLLGESDINALDSQAVPTRLLTLPPDEPLSSEVREYLHSRWPSHAVLENATFRRRNIWYAIPKQDPPDGIISYFATRGPRLIVNQCLSAATNSMFCLWLDDGIYEGEKKTVLASISLSMLSGIGRSYSELYANRFGNGAIKLGVGALNKMPVFIASEKYRLETHTAIAEADMALRNGNQTAAAQIANLWLRNVSASPRIVQEIETAAASMYHARIGVSER